MKGKVFFTEGGGFLGIGSASCWEVLTEMGWLIDGRHGGYIPPGPS